MVSGLWLVVAGQFSAQYIVLGFSACSLGCDCSLLAVFVSLESVYWCVCVVNSGMSVVFRFLLSF